MLFNNNRNIYFSFGWTTTMTITSSNSSKASWGSPTSRTSSPVYTCAFPPFKPSTSHFTSGCLTRSSCRSTSSTSHLEPSSSPPPSSGSGWPPERSTRPPWGRRTMIMDRFDIYKKSNWLCYVVNWLRVCKKENWKNLVCNSQHVCEKIL